MARMPLKIALTGLIVVIGVAIYANQGPSTRPAQFTCCRATADEMAELTPPPVPVVNLAGSFSLSWNPEFEPIDPSAVPSGLRTVSFSDTFDSECQPQSAIPVLEVVRADELQLRQPSCEGKSGQPNRDDSDRCCDGGCPCCQPKPVNKVDSPEAPKFKLTFEIKFEMIDPPSNVTGLFGMAHYAWICQQSREAAEESSQPTIEPVKFSCPDDCLRRPHVDTMECRPADRPGTSGNIPY